MKTVKTYNTRIEAELAKSLLESLKIPAFVSADDEGGLHSAMAYGRGVRLLVNEQNFKEAEEILSHDIKD